MSSITRTESSSASWLALVIGNSRLHWAWFIDDNLQKTWHTPHLQNPLPLSQIWEGAGGRATVDAEPDLWIASVVPAQSQFWAAYSPTHFLNLEQIPLQAVYPTLGVDRALAVWGAIATVSSPVLVIDAGTALTVTGADAHHQFIGGAILPGLRLQFQALNQGTAALPFVEVGEAGDREQGRRRGDTGTQKQFKIPCGKGKALQNSKFSSAAARSAIQNSKSPYLPISPSPHSPLPPRWAINTPDAIASGILYTLLAGIQDFITHWWQQFPDSRIVLTGGDGDRLHYYLQQYSPVLAEKLAVDPNLIFWGIRAVRNGNKNP